MVRLSFVARVYGLVALQMLGCLACCGLTLYLPGLCPFQRKTWWLAIVSGGLGLLTILLAVVSPLGKLHPYKHALFAAYMACLAYSASEVCCVTGKGGGNPAILLGFVMGFGLAFSMSFFILLCLNRRRPVSLLLQLGWVLLTSGIMLAGLAFLLPMPFLTVLLCALCAFAGGCYLAFDSTWLSYANRYGLCLDNSVLASLVLYIDVVFLLLELLLLVSRL